MLEVYASTLASVEISKWICVEETAKGKVHFHMAISTRSPHRWSSVKAELKRAKISVHFSAHAEFCTAAKYLLLPSTRKPFSQLDRHPLLAECLRAELWKTCVTEPIGKRLIKQHKWWGWMRTPPTFVDVLAKNVKSLLHMKKGRVCPPPK